MKVDALNHGRLWISRAKEYIFTFFPLISTGFIEPAFFYPQSTVYFQIKAKIEHFIFMDIFSYDVLFFFLKF